LKVWITYCIYGGGGFDGFQYFGPVFTKKEDAEKWTVSDERDKDFHYGYDEVELKTTKEEKSL